MCCFVSPCLFSAGSVLSYDIFTRAFMQQLRVLVFNVCVFYRRKRERKQGYETVNSMASLSPIAVLSEEKEKRKYSITPHLYTVDSKPPGDSSVGKRSIKPARPCNTNSKNRALLCKPPHRVHVFLLLPLPVLLPSQLERGYLLPLLPLKPLGRAAAAVAAAISVRLLSPLLLLLSNLPLSSP